MPHHIDILIGELVLHPVRNLDAHKHNQHQDSSEQKMSLNDSFNPALELILALDVETGVVVLSASSIVLVKIPLHSDQVSLWTFEFIDVC